MLPMTNKQISNKIWKRVYTAVRFIAQDHEK